MSVTGSYTGRVALVFPGLAALVFPGLAALADDLCREFIAAGIQATLNYPPGGPPPHLHLLEWQAPSADFDQVRAMLGDKLDALRGRTPVPRQCWLVAQADSVALRLRYLEGRFYLTGTPSGDREIRDALHPVELPDAFFRAMTLLQLPPGVEQQPVQALLYAYALRHDARLRQIIARASAELWVRSGGFWTRVVERV